MCFFLFSCTHQGSWKTHVGMYHDMYHMKIEEITSKTKKQKENNSPWNFTPESKEHNICKEIYYHTGQWKRRWAIEYLQCISRYKDAILYGFKTQQKKCSTVNNKKMDLSTYCNCTIRPKPFWNQIGISYFLFSRSSMKWKVLRLWKLSAHSDVTLTQHDAFLRSFRRLQMILCCQCVIRIDLCPNLRVRPSLEVRQI